MVVRQAKLLFRAEHAGRLDAPEPFFLDHAVVGEASAGHGDRHRVARRDIRRAADDGEDVGPYFHPAQGELFRMRDGLDLDDPADVDLAEAGDSLLHCLNFKPSAW